MKVVDQSEEAEYTSALCEGILEAYVGIVQALKAGNKANLLTKFIPNMFHFMMTSSNDEYIEESTIRATLGLLG